MNCSSLDVLKSAGAVHHIFLSLAWKEVGLAMLHLSDVTFLDRLCSLGIPADKSTWNQVLLPNGKPKKPSRAK